MNDSTGNNRQAFAIMPFDEEFDSVYKGVIKSSLSEVGFTVKRADDIDSQQNILRDIIGNITSSNLVIADLTGANPNVFYELGLAHALRKPVILITQDIEDVPFDLKSYRMIVYTTHFADVETTRCKLRDLAKGLLDQSVPFGSPVTDFQPADVPSVATPGAELATSELSLSSVEDDRGLFDHQEALEDGYSGISKLIRDVNKEMQTLTVYLQEKSKEVKDVRVLPGNLQRRARREWTGQVADRIAEFNTLLKTANIDYARRAADTENSLEFVAALQRTSSATPSAEIAEQRELLQSVLDASTQARDAFLHLATLIDGLPRMERRFDQVVAQCSNEVLAMAENIDRTIASISRALKFYR